MTLVVTDHGAPVARMTPEAVSVRDRLEPCEPNGSGPVVNVPRGRRRIEAQSVEAVSRTRRRSVRGTPSSRSPCQPAAPARRPAVSAT